MSDASIAGRHLIYPGWKIVCLTFLLIMLGSGTVFYGYSVYAISFATAFDASRTMINAGFTAVLVVSGGLSFVVSNLLARWGLKAVGLVGCIGTSIGLALVSLATSMWQVLILFGTLIALADTLIGAVLCNTLLTHWFERRRGLVMGVTMMGASAAAVIYPPLTSALTQAIGWRATFLFHAATLLLLTPFVVMWANTPDEGIPAFERLPKPPHDPATKHAPRLSTGAILRNADFWGVTIAVGTLSGLNGAILITMVPFAMEEGVARTNAALLVSIIGLTAFFGKLAFGLLADRVNLRIVLRLALLAAATAMLLLYLGTGFGIWAGASALCGLSLGGMMPVWGAIFAALHKPQDYPTVIGWSRTLMTPQTVLLPMLSGIIYDMTGAYDSSWLIYLGLTLAAFGCTFLRSRCASPINGAA